MKNLFILLIAFFIVNSSFAQGGAEPADKNPEQLKVIYVNKDVSTHFIAIDKIKYVDISVPEIVGDIPLNNTLRIKPTKEGACGIITITTERFLVQYMLIYTNDINKANTRYNILQEDVKSYINPETKMTSSEMYDYSYKMYISDNRFYDVSNSSNKIKVTLNNIYTVGSYFFIDLSVLNKSNIQYDIDQIRFKIEDKKITKATSFQSVEILPVLTLRPELNFKKNYRNIFVFDKFTFPDEKSFTIEVSEKQISGRTILLRIDYQDILNADSFIN